MIGDEVLFVKKRNGRLEELNLDKINKCIERACIDLENVSVSEIALDAHVQLYNKVTTTEIDKALILCAKSKIEKDPNYSYVAARLLLNTIYKEVCGEGIDSDTFELQYRKSFIANLKKLVNAKRIDEKLLDFDLKELSNYISVDRDLKFKYLGIQTLYDRYFIHIDGRRMESPQAFWMRVAMGLSINEENKNEMAKKFYDVMSNMYYSPSTPTLFNSGTCFSQLSSCYLSTVDDSIDGIFGTIHNQARLSKYAGGLGVDWTPIRAANAYIAGTNGNSNGLIPWLKIFNDTLVAVNQCFAPDTLIYTSNGIKKIKDISESDFILDSKGEFTKVKSVLKYEQTEEMVEIEVNGNFNSIQVTSGHPIYSKNDSNLDWIEAGKLKVGDFVAQPIPQDINYDKSITEEDAYIYGLMLVAGIIKDEEATLIIEKDKNNQIINYIEKYLKSKNTDFIEHSLGKNIVIIWKLNEKIPFTVKDLPNTNLLNTISSRFSNLPIGMSFNMLKAIAEYDGLTTGKHISFCTLNYLLAEDIRYQLLRTVIPSAISELHFDPYTDETTVEILKTLDNKIAYYRIDVPAVEEIASIFNISDYIEKTWTRIGNFILHKITKINNIEPCKEVYDLKVEGREEYSTNMFLAHNGGKRKGAGCAYLETWHKDIESFLDLRKNTGDERSRCHDMNTANWIPDEFMKRVKEDSDWYLFSPSDVPDLHESYGKDFIDKYNKYIDMAKSGDISNFEVVSAKTLWKKMLTVLFETGHPWITFKDPSNIRYSNKHVGTVKSSNLCTEILLHTVPSEYDGGKITKTGETAVCNLGSLNLINILRQSDSNLDKFYKNLKHITDIAVRMLDNVIDINFYPTEEARNANMRNRPVGLGIMGFHDCLHELKINYDSDGAVEISGDIQEHISYQAIKSSAILAKQRGRYENYEGSLWSQNIFPIDSYNIFMKEHRDSNTESSGKLDWSEVRELVKENGMRNSNTMAIAPTATISYIQGCSQSIEPDYSLLHSYSTLSGDFTMLNEYFVRRAKEMGIWDNSLVDALKKVDGDVSLMDLTEDIKDEFKNSFEMSQIRLIDCAAERQKWIDMGQSLNIYSKITSLKYINDIYMHAWEKGLKTTYYLRSQSISKVEKSTVDNFTKSENEIQACSIEAAKMGIACESCQ